MAVRALCLAIALLSISLLGACGSPELRSWHTVDLREEFSARRDGGTISGFADYLALEARLFDEQARALENASDLSAAAIGSRYRTSRDMALLADQRDWNRSVELPADKPRGGVLLLHGMSDSPYSLHQFARALAARRYHVIALRYPGHGTLPSGLRDIRSEDLTAAVRLAAVHLAGVIGPRPLHLIGYSTGATLALEYSLDAIASDGLLVPPTSLVLLSPAIRVSAAAALARFKHALSSLPGSEGLAWLNVLPETDPYKYNSFATNAAAVVHQLTRSLDRRLRAAPPEYLRSMPPVLAIKSTVDATVETDALVDHLLKPLGQGGHELLLFDINRLAALRGQLAVDPDHLARRLERTAELPFTVTLVSNEAPDTPAVSARTRGVGETDYTQTLPLANGWPADTLSLSHIALPFPPDDPTYGNVPPQGEAPWLGNLSLRGERGVSVFPPEFLLRMRYNPFFDYTLKRSLHWLETAESRGGVSAQISPGKQ